MNAPVSSWVPVVLLHLIWLKQPIYCAKKDLNVLALTGSHRPWAVPRLHVWQPPSKLKALTTRFPLLARPVPTALVTLWNKSRWASRMLFLLAAAKKSIGLSPACLTQWVRFQPNTMRRQRTPLVPMMLIEMALLSPVAVAVWCWKSSNTLKRVEPKSTLSSLVTALLRTATIWSPLQAKALCAA